MPINSTRQKLGHRRRDKNGHSNKLSSCVFELLFYGHEMNLEKFRKMVGSMKIEKDGTITTSKVTQ